LKNEKPTVIQQKLNGYRKKNKLSVPAVQIDDINLWIANINDNKE
jgi:hypothetical protein